MDHIVCIIVTLLYLLLSKQHYIEDRKKSCDITFSHLNSEPIVVSPTYEFLYPEHENLISVDLFKDVIISCPGGNIIAKGIQFDTLEKVFCVPGNQFTVNKKNMDFNQIMCSRQPLHTARLTQKQHETGVSEIEIGFNVTDEIFIPQIYIYFNESNLSPLYSIYNLTKSIGNYETNIPRPNHFNKDFYIDGADDLFDKVRQRRTINNLTGLPIDSTKYIKNGSNNYFLTRGHLSPKSGFFFGAQQRATFYYVNVAPQWESFNSGNWKQVEQDVKEYATVNQVDLIIYTGVYGITTLRHETTGEEVPLYLYTLNEVKKIPVPELYWKVVYDPVAKRGIALVGVNNPYQGNVSNSIICNNISSSVKWLRWDANNIELGYSYACTVQDFSSSVPYLPDLKINGILF